MAQEPARDRFRVPHRTGPATAQAFTEQRVLRSRLESVPALLSVLTLHATLFVAGLACNCASGQDGHKPSSFSHPNDFRSVPTFASARLDVRGEVEISTFLFEDPVDAATTHGKVFRFIQRYPIERLQVFLATNQQLKHGEVRRRLQHPCVVLLKSGDSQILGDWLELFSPETLVIQAPPAATDMEEIREQNELPSPQYGQNPPQFDYALRATSTALTLRSVRSESSIAAPGTISKDRDATPQTPAPQEVSVINCLDDVDFETANLVRIRRTKARISLEPIALNSLITIPGPCLLFQAKDRTEISDFYLSIIKPDSLVFATGLKLPTNAVVNDQLKSPLLAKEDRNVLLAQVGPRMRRVKTLIQRREYQTALSEITEVIQIDHEEPLPHYLLAFIAHQSGKTTEAVQAVTTGVECERLRPIKNWYQQLEWLQGPSRIWLDDHRHELSSH